MEGRLHLEHDIKNFSDKKVKHPDHFAADDPDVFTFCCYPWVFIPVGHTSLSWRLHSLQHSHSQAYAVFNGLFFEGRVIHRSAVICFVGDRAQDNERNLV